MHLFPFFMTIIYLLFSLYVSSLFTMFLFLWVESFLFSLRGKECNDPNYSFDGLGITRKYERNKRQEKLYSFQDEMSIYGTAHMARLQIEESSQLTERLLQCERAESNHVGLICIWLDCFYMASPLSHVFEGIRDRRGSASGSLALSINSRRFCTERQS